MAALNSTEELRAFARTHLGAVSDLGYWQKTALINKAYAFEFGHAFIMSNLSKYRNVYRERRPSV